MKNKRIALVTGATGGIGKEFVKALIKEHTIGNLDEIWAVARNSKRLSRLVDEYDGVVVPIISDISKTDELEKLSEHLHEVNPQITYLINNAGIARLGESCEFSLKEIEDTININCKAPVMLINICRPYMISGSHIANISSASSFQPNPYINLYASTKAFERSYSRALNVELKNAGISVTAVCPSWVDTPLIPKEKNGRKIKYPGLVTPESVVKRAMKDINRGRDMSVCSLYVKCQHVDVKLLPQRISMKLWMKWLRKYE